MNLVGLGIKAAQAGFWGNDAEMRELSALLTTAGVDFSGMSFPAMPQFRRPASSPGTSSC